MANYTQAEVVAARWDMVEKLAAGEENWVDINTWTPENRQRYDEFLASLNPQELHAVFNGLIDAIVEARFSRRGRHNG